MAGAPLALLKADWHDGRLRIKDLSENSIIEIYPSTGGVLFGNAGGVTISSGVTVYGGTTLSGGSSLTGGDVTVSSGRLAFNGQSTVSVAASATLTASCSGVIQLVTASDVILTLPGAASTGKMLCYTVVNTLTTAGQAVVITCTGEIMTGGGFGNSGANIAANTGATHSKGDCLQIMNTVTSTSWSVMGMVGTWASTT